MIKKNICLIALTICVIAVMLCTGCRGKDKESVKEYETLPLDKYAQISKDVNTVYFAIGGWYKIEKGNIVYEGRESAKDDPVFQRSGFILMSNPEAPAERILFNTTTGKIVDANNCIPMISFETGEVILMNYAGGRSVKLSELIK